MNNSLIEIWVANKSEPSYYLGGPDRYLMCTDNKQLAESIIKNLEKKNYVAYAVDSETGLFINLNQE